MAVHPGLPASGFPEGASGDQQVRARQRTGSLWGVLLMASTLVGIVALLALLYNVIDSSFGYVAVQNSVEPAALVADYGEDPAADLADLPKEALIAMLADHVSAGLMRRLENDQPFAERTQ